MSERNGPDWEAIERDYRAGLLSIRAIAEKHDSNEGTIRSRAKKNGWMRDLTEQVRTATQSKLTGEPSRSIVTQSGECVTLREEAEIIEEASSEAAALILSHRAGLARWGKIADRLCDALAEIPINAENHGDIARSLNAGIDAQLKVIKGQRQAYNLDEVSSEESFEDRLTRLVGGSA